MSVPRDSTYLSNILIMARRATSRPGVKSGGTQTQRSQTMLSRLLTNTMVATTPIAKTMPSSKRRHQRLAALLAAATFFLASPSISSANAADASSQQQQQQQQQCERLPTSLTYSQDTAPADVSAILRVVVEKINRDVKGVVDVEVQWTGAELHKRVGEYIVKCTVTRLAESVDDAKNEEGGHGKAAVDDQSTVDEQGRRIITQCFEVPFTILDVNECTVPSDNSMAHRCHSPSLCVNTLGSYECLCPSESPDSSINAIVKDGTRNFVVQSFWQELARESRNSWEVSLGSSAESSCPGSASTHGCCEEDGQSKEGKVCRSSFRCPVDPCTKSSRGKTGAACASNAICKRTTSPLSHPNYLCQCPPGLMGNGFPCRSSNMKQRKEPKVKYDGKTPTEDTRRALESNLICGCWEPIVDACDGFPKCPGKHEMCTVSSSNTPHCTCQTGYVHDPDYGCVDENPPVLHIRPDPKHGTDPKTGITHLSQGDKYEEYGVDVIDDNAEEYLRSLKITYSKPLPQGCLLEMDEFHVNYTVATPWTTPEFVRAKRTVIIDNVNECTVKEGVGVGLACPELVAKCDIDAGAMCKDEIGTYTCKCPKGTEGDGFKPITRLKSDGKGGFMGSMVPQGYQGGTGCLDTSEPVIELLGPNPKRFRVAKAGAVKGVMRMDGTESEARVKKLIAEQRSAYEEDIRSIIKATSGAELCATTTKPAPNPTDCVRAEDHTYKGIVNLSSRVIVGEPVPKDNNDRGAPLQWEVPYNVMDDAGNKAKTVWRDIIIEEVDINDFERRAKADVVASHKDEVDRAVKEAVAKERRRKTPTRDCPPCEPCTCSDGQRDMIAVSECNARCDDMVAAASETPARGGSEETCAPSYLEGDSSASSHEIVQQMLVFIEGLVGPSAMILLLLGCTITTMLYVMARMFTALFFSTGPNVRDYYHTREDDERERIMMQNVSYYRSPTPSTANGSRHPSPGSASSATPASSGLRPPPNASLSSQRNGIFSPHDSRTPQQQQQQQRSPFHSRDGTDNIYQSMSPITPLRNSTPSSAGPQGQRSPYNLRN